MIRLESVSKGFWVRDEYRVVIDDLTITLPTGASLALLGRNGAGKTTLLRIIAGTMRPDSGQLFTDGSISWPVGYAGSVHPDLSGVQNTRFLARAYGVDSDALVAFVEDFAEIGDHFYMPVRSYSQGMRARLAFGISMGIRFDTYLIDEVTAVGDTRFRRKSRAVFRERMLQSSAIMVSHNHADLRQFCDAAILLHEGKLEYFGDVGAAIRRHESLMA